MSATTVLFESGRAGAAPASVVVPLHNYAHLVIEALDSVAAQTMDALELVVVDDASTDGSADVVREWLRDRADRFSRVLLLRQGTNQGLAATRNSGVEASSSPLFLPLDADNVLYPRCLALLERALRDSSAAFAYPMLEAFEADRGIMGAPLWDPARLARMNYIDALALIRVEAWRNVGGYVAMQGWEDYDLWCRFHEAGHFGIQVPSILARYRVHYSSMLRTLTNRAGSQATILETMRRRHPWLTL